MWPTSSPGKWSVVSFAIFLLGAIVLFAAAASGQRGGENLLDNLWLGIPALVGLIGAISSMITGLTAVVSRSDRSVVVVLAAAGQHSRICLCGSNRDSGLNIRPTGA